MKKFGMLVILGVIIAFSASPVFASPISFGQISIAGTNTYTATTISFAPGSTTIGGAITGTFAPYFTDGTQVTMFNFATDSGFVPQTVFSVTENGETLTFFLQTLSTIFSNGGIPSSYPGNITLSGYGFFTETGAINYLNSPANLNLTSQYGGGSAVTFSETSFAVLAPEPDSLILFGTGLVSAAIVLNRKKPIPTESA